MDLSVSWVNALRVGKEKAAVEAVYRDELLNAYGTPENALSSREEFERHNHPVNHPWRINNINAHVRSCKDLLPSEKHLAHFIVGRNDI